MLLKVKEKPLKYLAEIEHAEHEILSRFHEFINNIADFLASFGIAARHSWYLIELPMNLLVPSIHGEVDILVGNFQFSNPDEFQRRMEAFSKQRPNSHPLFLQNYCAMTLAWDGGLRWPPSLDYLVGIEAKSSYLPLTASEISEDQIRSKKASKAKIREIRKGASKLLKLGFDKVGLFEFIANPPADGVGSRPWTLASYIAGNSLDAMENIFALRLGENSPVGHGACSISGVNGRDESESGAFSFHTFRLPQNNPLLVEDETKSNRQTMEQNLNEILRALPHPRAMPAVFIYDKQNRKISYANEGEVSL